jgi:hypothetical protein
MLAVGQAEIKGVVDRAAALLGALRRLVPADAFAAVFDDAFPGFDRAHGEHAVAVDRRTPYLVDGEGFRCGCLGRLLRRGRWCWIAH